MNKLNYAFAMLTAVGGSVGLSSAAHAITLYGSFTNPSDGYSETFSLQSDGGVVNADPAYTDFTLSNDSLGNTLATVGNDTTGFKGSGYFGTGSSSGPFGGQTADFFKPALYSGSSPGVLQAGTYDGFFGSTVVLSAVPEPEAWALLIAGAGLVGGVSRNRRRRVPAAA